MVESFFSILDAVFYNSLGVLFVTLGILITIRFTGFPDLTVDGSFTIGAATYSLLIINSASFFVAFLSASIVGFLTGCLTALLNRIFGISKIMSGIIVMILAILIVPYLGINSSIGLINKDTFFNQINHLDKSITESFSTEFDFSYHIIFIIIWLLFFLIACILLLRFFSSSRKGLEIRYNGTAEKPGLVKKKNRIVNTFIGLGIGNMLISIGGIIEVERRGGFSQNMGQGILLVGIATLILGESILKSKKKRYFLGVKEYLYAVVIGTMIYSLGIQLILDFTNISVDLRLSSTILLLGLLIFSSKKFSNKDQLF